jgi:hypothetical protein
MGQSTKPPHGGQSQTTKEVRPPPRSYPNTDLQVSSSMEVSTRLPYFEQSFPSAQLP